MVTVSLSSSFSLRVRGSRSRWRYKTVFDLILTTVTAADGSSFIIVKTFMKVAGGFSLPLLSPRAQLVLEKENGSLDRSLLA